MLQRTVIETHRASNLVYIRLCAGQVRQSQSHLTSRSFLSPRVLRRGVVGDSTGLKVFVVLICAMCTGVLFRDCVVCGTGYNQWNAGYITLLTH